jgi:phosphatidylglycerophosphate synthase
VGSFYCCFNILNESFGSSGANVNFNSLAKVTSKHLSTALHERLVHAPLARVGGRFVEVLSSRTARVWSVQVVSLSRLIATLLFAAVALKGFPHVFKSCILLFAMVTDLIDGYLSRQLKAETYFGQILDLAADKSLTIICLMYAVGRGIDVLPLATIAMREIVMIGMRLITIENNQLLPTNRIFGGIMAVLLWGNTLVLVNIHAGSEFIRLINVTYWVSALIFSLNLMTRVYSSRQRIKFASQSVTSARRADER